MVFKFGGRVYSVSDQNMDGEFVVVKLHPKTRAIEAVKIVKAEDKEQVKKYVKKYSFNKFKDLPN